MTKTDKIFYGLFGARIASVVFVLAWSACRDPEVPGKDVVDAGTSEASAPPALHECTLACANLSRLGCPEASPKPGERTCFAMCYDAQQSEHFDLKPKCIANAASREELLACKTVRCR